MQEILYLLQIMQELLQTNNLTVAPNGSDKIGAANACNFNTEGQSVTFVYVDATQGWIIQDSTSNVRGTSFYYSNRWNNNYLWRL